MNTKVDRVRWVSGWANMYDDKSKPKTQEVGYIYQLYISFKCLEFIRE